MRADIDKVWAISLMVIGICSLVISGSNVIGIELPDLLTRILGIIELVALPVLAFTSIKKVMKKDKGDN